jgi:hypothetical protein
MEHDLSDEATRLPPLNDIRPEYSIFVLQWLLGIEGIVTDGDGSDVPVRYLSVRGITVDSGQPQYSQVHLAIPHHAVRPLLQRWLELLDQEEREIEGEG